MPAFRPVQARSKGQHHASDVWPYYGAGQCSVAAISRALHARSTLVRTNLHRIHETQRRIHTRHLIRMRCLVQQSAQHTAHSIRRCAVFHSMQHTAYGAVLCFTACSTQHTALCCVSQHAAKRLVHARHRIVFHSIACTGRTCPSPAAWRPHTHTRTHAHTHTQTQTQTHARTRTHTHARTCPSPAAWRPGSAAIAAPSAPGRCRGHQRRCTHTRQRRRYSQTHTHTHTLPRASAMIRNRGYPARAFYIRGRQR
jgi:hypothetical protein